MAASSSSSSSVASAAAASSSSSSLLKLHHEIMEFSNSVSPTIKEREIREAAIQRVTTVIKALWPSSEVKVYGSFVTGLYLPESDIDIVILNSGSGSNGPSNLSKALNDASIATKMEVIGRASIPIVKFIEKKSSIQFDISFDSNHGPNGANYIQGVLKDYPSLKPLSLVVKRFLKERQLNEVFKGGIGSQQVVVMLFAQIQMYGKKENDVNKGTIHGEHNLGALLVDFLDFYGNRLDTQNIGVCCKNGGSFYNKRSRGCRFYEWRKPYLLSIEDPMDANIDLGIKSYDIRKVLREFRDAHKLLTTDSTSSLLGCILRDYRNLPGRKG